MRTQHKWTDALEATLREIFSQGSHAWIMRQINEQYGTAFTRNAIIGKCQRIGLVTKEAKPKHKQTTSRAKVARKAITGFDYDDLPKADGPKLTRIIIENFAQYAAPEFLGLTLAQLKDDFSQCRFIKDDSGTPLYCGQPVKEGSSYCPHCHSVCWQPAPGPRPRKQYLPSRRAA
jgi:GcrA cell cycle regulator